MEQNPTFTTIRSNSPYKSIKPDNEHLTTDEFAKSFPSSDFEIYSLKQLKDFVYDANKQKNDLTKSDEYESAEEIFKSAQDQLSSLKEVSVLTSEGSITMFVREKIVDIEKSVKDEAEIDTLEKAESTDLLKKHNFKTMSNDDYHSWGGAPSDATIKEIEHKGSNGPDHKDVDAQTTIFHTHRNKEDNNEPTTHFEHYGDDGGQGVQTRFVGHHASNYALKHHKDIANDLNDVRNNHMTHDHFVGKHHPSYILGAGKVSMNSYDPKVDW